MEAKRSAVQKFDVCFFFLYSVMYITSTKKLRFSCFIFFCSRLNVISASFYFLLVVLMVFLNDILVDA